MSDEFDLVHALAAGLQDRHQAWDFVRRFVATWHQPLVATDGWSSSELREAVRNLSTRFPTVKRLPAALAETYALLGNRRDLTSNQDQLLNANGLWLDEAGEVLVMRQENQGCAEWGIRVDDLDHDDPPVVMQVAGSEHGWQPYADRWSLACIEMVLFESLFTEDDLCTNMELDDRSWPLSSGSRYFPSRCCRTGACRRCAGSPALTSTCGRTPRPGCGYGHGLHRHSTRPGGC